MKTKLIILTITVLALTSCRKYEEGGKYFLANMSKKIAGTYHFTHYYIDGVDSVDYYFNNEYTAELDLHYNQERDERVGYFTYEHNNDVYKNFGFHDSWNWNDKKNTSILIKLNDEIEYTDNNTPDTTINNGPFSPGVEHVWDILKLKRGYLILETDYNNKHYRVELK